MVNNATGKSSIDALAADDVIFVDDTSASGATKSFTPAQMATFVGLEAGSGDVVGPASSTDNAVARFDSTTGKLLQNSGVTIDDSDNIAANNLSGTNTGDMSNADVKTAYEANSDTNAFTDSEQTLLGNQSGTNTGDQTTEQIQDAAWDVLTGTQTLITVTYQDGTNDVDFVVNNDLSAYDNSSSGFITATLTDEQVQDITGAMVTGNTETLITVTYQDGDGTLDFVVDNDLANYSNASSAFITDITGDNLSALADVTITAIGSGELLKWNGSAWINNTLSEVGIQPLDAELSAIAGLTSAADKGIQFTGSGAAATYDLTTAGKALLDDASASAQRTTMGVAIGSDVQAHDSVLDATTASFTTADETKLDGIETSATADQTGAEIAAAIDIENLDARSAFASGDKLIIWEDGVGNRQIDYTDLPGAGGGLSNIVEDTTPQLGGDLDLNGKNLDFPTTANISDCLDEDDMTSNSATMLATQQSIKAYADTKLANVVEDTTPQLGGDLDCNGKNQTDVQELRIDATPDADHTATGLTTNTINAGVTTAIGELLYLATDGEWALADADAESTASGSLAISLAVGSDGSPLLVSLPGSFVRDDTWAWTVGAVLYVSTTAGGLTETAPSGSGDIVRIAGTATHADRVHFVPGSSYAEVA